VGDDQALHSGEVRDKSRETVSGERDQVPERIKFKDIRHIVHVAIIVVAVIVIFLIARALTVPESFGQYGHYRGDSIKERQDFPVTLQTPQTCKECHEEELGDWWPGFEAWHNGKHSSLTCENCHSNLKEHVELWKRHPDLVGMRKDQPEEFSTRKRELGLKDPIAKDNSPQLCLLCHHAMAARPAVLPIFDPTQEDHANYLELLKEEMEEVIGCNVCHPTYRPHNPELAEDEDEG
jgi:hypothetical protein